MVITRPVTSTSISIHPPLAGRDVTGIQRLTIVDGISIHPPLAGRDDGLKAWLDQNKVFQSTRPSRDGTLLSIFTLLW